MLWAVIMAGGSGTRFWPESREKKPKQFLKIFGRKTLLRETVSRLSGVVPKSRIFVVTQKTQMGQVKKILKMPSSQIVGEPVGRNTAPCAALAASLVLKKDPRAVLAILPSDHRIDKVKVFKKAVKAAAEITQRERMPVTFGIKPAFSHTGYGYLEIDRMAGKSNGFSYYRLKCFHEKPSLLKARSFLKSRRFLWNSGMFFWRADDLLMAADRYLLQMARLIQKIAARDVKERMRRFYAEVENISIDYGLMEKMRGRILALPVDLGWHDLGGWRGFADLCRRMKPPELWRRDPAGNIHRGNVLLIESSGNIVKSDERLIAMVGVHDFAVVDSKDALLVCPKSQAESVRKIVAVLKSRDLKKYL